MSSFTKIMKELEGVRELNLLVAGKLKDINKELDKLRGIIKWEHSPKSSKENKMLKNKINEIEKILR